MALFSREFHHKPKKREIPFSNRRHWHYFPEKPKKTRKSRFQMRFPSQAQKKHGNSVFKQKILASFSRGFHHKPKKREIPFSNRRYWHYFPEVPITSPKRHGNSVFKQKILILFSRGCHHKPKKKKGNPVFKQKILALFSRGSHHKRKKREIPFSNRRYWHCFPEKPTKTRQSRFQMRFPSQAQKKTRKIRFQIEDIGIIFQRFHHKPKKREIPFSNRRYWHYFPEKPKKTRKSRFKMRFPSQAQKGNPVFKQKILALFSRKAKKDTEIPFSNEVPITSPKKGKSRFQIEDVGIIFQKSPKRHGNPVFK